MKKYSGYKEGTNSRGLPSSTKEKPEVTAREMAESEGFQNTCKRASEKIQELKLEGDEHARTCQNEVKATPRQARRFRNKNGSAYKYGRN